MRLKSVDYYLGLVVVVAGLSGCQNLAENGDAAAEAPAAEQPRSLVQAKSSTEFEAYLKRGLAESVSAARPVALEMAASTVAMDANAGSERVSSTNVQVGGVDEGDLVKTDGQYLYAVQQPSYRYYPIALDSALVPGVSPVEPMPAQSGSTSVTSSSVIAPVEVELERPATIRILKIQSDPAFSEPVGRIEIPEGKGRFNSLYLAAGEENRRDLLVAIGDAGNGWGWGDWGNPWFWQRGSVNVWGYDVSDPAQVEKAYSIDIEGYLLTSRRIGDTLYLVTRHTPSIPGYTPYQTSDAQRKEGQELLAAATVESLLPKIRINGGEPESLVSATRCFLPAETQRRHYSPSVITLTAINVREPQKRESVCYGGDSFSFYASTESFYLTRSDYGYTPVGTLEEIQAESAPREQTFIHKFALMPNGARYEASGAVPGTIRSSHPSFMMAERDGLFYIVTSSGFGQKVKHRLTVLAQKERRLSEYASLPNKARPAAIGKPGERLYASRFLGDKAYLVTFRNIDPLYVLDLSDASDPKIAGELEMPGYSGYLHPVGRDRLLGIGQDASDAGRLQGVKVSLFDVSDMTQPREINSLVLGDSGTYTPLLYDHLALAYLAGDEGEADRFAFPLSLYKSDVDPAAEGSWPRWVHDGLYLFDIGTELRHSGVVVGADGSDGRGMSGWGERAVIQGSAVHYVRDQQVISAEWGAALR